MIVTLVSGGLDSMLMAVLTRETGVDQLPLFINYGQIFYQREYDACIAGFRRLQLPRPQKMSIPGFGRLISSGLTNKSKHVVRQAFLPNRNLLFLTCGAAYAAETGANAIGVGLLNEETHLFPDQTQDFIDFAQVMISKSLGRQLQIVAPLMRFNKAEVMALAINRGITRWYSCHRGTKRPCGRCISCREYHFERDRKER